MVKNYLLKKLQEDWTLLFGVLAVIFGVPTETVLVSPNFPWTY